jgi:hypothetical protein
MSEWRTVAHEWHPYATRKPALFADEWRRGARTYPLYVHARKSAFSSSHVRRGFNPAPLRHYLRKEGSYLVAFVRHSCATRAPLSPLFRKDGNLSAVAQQGML